MTHETPTKIDLDLVRRELGIKVPYERPLTQSLTMFGLGILVSWTLIYLVIGEGSIRQTLHSLGVLG